MRKQPPLILHVIHHLVTGGMENGLVNLINNLSPDRYRHAIACVEDFSEFRERINRRDVEVFSLRRSQIGVWRMRKELYRLCKTMRPAIVHSRNQSGLDALLPARLAGVRICVQGEHGWDVGNLTGSHWRPRLVQQVHAPLVSRFIVVSKDIERHLINSVGIAPSRISQIYNGVDASQYTPRGERNGSLAPPGFLTPDSILVGTVGRIQAVKDQATLVRSFGLLLQGNKNLHSRLRLAIVGNGPLLQDLRILATDLGIAQQCWFPGDRVDVPKILQLFDVFVLPSLNEGISNTILEAMASGLPVIAGRVGGNVEILSEPDTGFFFSPGDTDTLTNLLRRYVDDVDLRHSHGAAARKTVLARFSIDSMVGHYQAVYDQLLN